MSKIVEMVEIETIYALKDIRVKLDELFEASKNKQTTREGAVAWQIRTALTYFDNLTPEFLSDVAGKPLGDFSSKLDHFVNHLYRLHIGIRNMGELLNMKAPTSSRNMQVLLDLRTHVVHSGDAIDKSALSVDDTCVYMTQSIYHRDARPFGALLLGTADFSKDDLYSFKFENEQACCAILRIPNIDVIKQTVFEHVDNFVNQKPRKPSKKTKIHSKSDSNHVNKPMSIDSKFGKVYGMQRKSSSDCEDCDADFWLGFAVKHLYNYLNKGIYDYPDNILPEPSLGIQQKIEKSLDEIINGTNTTIENFDIEHIFGIKTPFGDHLLKVVPNIYYDSPRSPDIGYALALVFGCDPNIYHGTLMDFVCQKYVDVILQTSESINEQ